MNEASSPQQHAAAQTGFADTLAALDQLRQAHLAGADPRARIPGIVKVHASAGTVLAYPSSWTTSGLLTVTLTCTPVPAQGWVQAAHALADQVPATALALGGGFGPYCVEASLQQLDPLLEALAATGTAAPVDLVAQCSCRAARCLHVVAAIGRLLSTQGIDTLMRWCGLVPDQVSAALRTVATDPGRPGAGEDLGAFYRPSRPLGARALDAQADALAVSGVDVLVALGPAPKELGGAAFEAALGEVYQQVALVCADRARVARELAIERAAAELAAFAQSGVEPAGVGSGERGQDGAGRPRPALVRAWARGQGLPVGQRGRLRASLRQAYGAAHATVG